MDCADTAKRWLLDRYREDSLFFVFCAVSIVFLLIFIIAVFATGGDALYNVLGVTHGDYFEDYFYSVVASSYRPYGLEHVIYPPLITSLYALIGTITMKYVDVPPGDAHHTFYILRDTQMGMMSYFLIVMLIIFLLYTLCLRKDSSVKTKIIFFFFLFSYSMVFSIERGNNIPLVLILCLFFFMFYRSENKTLRFLALLALSAAAGIKIYPIILALLILRERDFKGFVWCIILTALMYTIPFLFTDGNPMMLLNNIKNTSGDNLKVIGITGIHKYFMSPLVGILPDAVLTVLGYVIALAIGLIIFIIVMKDDRMEDWKMFLLVILTMIFAPSISTTEYMMVFMLVPVLYFFETRREPNKFNMLYSVLFALSMVMMVGFTLPFMSYQEQTMVSGTKTAILWILLFLVFVEGCLHLYRTRKAEPETQ